MQSLNIMYIRFDLQIQNVVYTIITKIPSQFGCYKHTSLQLDVSKQAELITQTYKHTYTRHIS